MYKFKPDSKAHTTWESTYNPYSDHNYKFARDARGVDMNGYFLPRNYFEDSRKDENDVGGFVVLIVMIVILGFVSLVLT
jgi:hypothetical protein